MLSHLCLYNQAAATKFQRYPGANDPQVSMSRLDLQLSFVLEIDKLKTILRQSLLTDSSRRENSAEHSWHLGVMALVLAEYAPQPLDLFRAMKMALVHDLIEVYAGDTPAYDAAANVTKAERELDAAGRIFELLPADLGQELRSLWEEFEASESLEARYVNALDRLQPLLHNSRSEGGTWRLRPVKRAQVYNRMEPIRTSTPELWPTVTRIIEEACERGWISS
jgi:putative hydrolase of HD superfamily